ncbi:hypothetical protein [Aliikangiella sp. IMCC44359]|uniref:hypothetical protein n=1 Tax=Aliikangiella sp. IMCC44359 TaxID=3459125 RepID=UPI00403A82B6
MFGPLFHSQKNPKGPNLKRLEKLVFDLSGNQLSFSVPYGNWFQMPEPQGEIFTKTNLFDLSQFERYKVKDKYTNKMIFNRHFSYSCFNHSSIGSFRLIVIVNKLDDLKDGLFNPQYFHEVVKKQNELSCQLSNEDVDNEFLKILPAKSYQFITLNEKFLNYEMSYQYSPYINYSIPLTSEHYIRFGFRYLTHLNNNEPCFLKARKLETQIMESVKLELTPSFEQERIIAISE